MLQAAMKKRRANMKIIMKRFVNTAGVSWMLTYQSMLYIGTVKFAGAIGLDKVLRYFQTDVEKMMARMTGMNLSPSSSYFGNCLHDEHAM